jgi:hypothetical protein
MLSSLMAIKIDGRIAEAPHVQEILTKYGCNIKTRIGFHETNEDHCSMDGVLILQLFGDEKNANDMMDELSKLEGVSPKIIEF